MIISDLEHLEVTTEEVIGGGCYVCELKKKYKPVVVKPKLVPISIAKADASADAVGGVVNIAKTNTETVAAPGIASSKSNSFAATIGEFGADNGGDDKGEDKH